MQFILWKRVQNIYSNLIFGNFVYNYFCGLFVIGASVATLLLSRLRITKFSTATIANRRPCIFASEAVKKTPP